MCVRGGGVGAIISLHTLHTYSVIRYSYSYQYAAHMMFTSTTYMYLSALSSDSAILGCSLISFIDDFIYSEMNECIQLWSTVIPDPP